MKSGSNKFRIHEGRYVLQILQKAIDTTIYRDSESDEMSIPWMQKEIIILSEFEDGAASAGKQHED